MQEEKVALSDDRTDLPIFVHSELDDLPLTSEAFRVYAHLARRAGRNNDAWPSYASIGKACFGADYPGSPGTQRNHAIAAMKELVKAGLINKVVDKTNLGDYGTNHYSLSPKSKWIISKDSAPVAEWGSIPTVPPSIPPVPQGSIPPVLGSIPPVPKGNTVKDTTIEGTKGKEDRDQSPIQPLTLPKDPPLQIKPNEYLPGLPDNRKKKTGQRAEIGETLAEASRLGVGAERFRVLVDQVLDDLGKKLLADAGDDHALNEGREIALYLLKMSAGQQSDLFFTPKGISGIMEQWRLGWAGGSLPSAKQYKELASAMLAGKVTKDLSNGKPTTNHLDRRSQAKADIEAEWIRQYGELYGDIGKDATVL